LLAKTGDESRVSMREVAAAAGVTPPAIYLHFADKAELMVAVCQREFGAFDRFVEAAIASIEDPVERLRERGRAYVRFGIEHPEQYRILFMDRTMPLPMPAMDAATGFGHLVANVEEAIASGGLAPGDPLVMSSGLWAVVHGITSLTIAVPGFPVVGLETLVEHLLDVQLRGLRSAG
jgi:AcrR family transcriptional regulator